MEGGGCGCGGGGVGGVGCGEDLGSEVGCLDGDIVVVVILIAKVVSVAVLCAVIKSGGGDGGGRVVCISTTLRMHVGIYRRVVVTAVAGGRKSGPHLGCHRGEYVRPRSRANRGMNTW